MRILKMLAQVTLELYKSGIRIICYETDLDDFIPFGCADKLIEHINEIYTICDDDTVYKLTDKGKEYLKSLENEED